jgi:hypothetical protein
MRTDFMFADLAAAVNRVSLFYEALFYDAASYTLHRTNFRGTIEPKRNWSFHRFTEFLLSRLFFFSSDSNLHANERGGMPRGAVHMHDSEKARN